MLRKVLTWGAIAFLIFFVAFNPSGAADVVKAIGNSAVDILAGMGNFFSSIVGG